MMLRLLLPLLLLASVAAHDKAGKSHAPASSKLLKSPLTAAQAKAELGRAKYSETCAACHGENGKGVANLKPTPADLTGHHMHSLKDGEIYWMITNGIGKTMPGFKTQLSETERWQVVLYVRQLSR